MTSSEVFKSWKPYDDFHAFVAIHPGKNSPKDLVLNHLQWAVCSSDLTRSYVLKFKKPVDVFSGSFGIWADPDKEQVQELEKLGEGDYHAAYLIDGLRCSNVFSFSIRGSRPSWIEPSIRVIAIPSLETDEIESVGLWIVPPKEGDPKLLYSAAHNPAVNGGWGFEAPEIDGLDRIGWSVETGNLYRGLFETR